MRAGARRACPAGRSRATARCVERMLAALPFALTACQQRAIARDRRATSPAPAPMLRLLQGDVGSGKTVVALAAMLQAVEAGAQAALMAPTEVLARQHAATLDRAAGAARPRGRAADRRASRPPPPAPPWPGSPSGEAALAVGTHALFQDGVEFRDLGLVVIDEQHRFGVGQRLDLVVKGQAVDVLLMTATPIPRSLVLAAYGDLASLAAADQAAGPAADRDPRACPTSGSTRCWTATERALAAGERIYWICPVIEGSEADTADGGGRAPSPARRALRAAGRAGPRPARRAATRRRRSPPSPPAGRRLLVATTVIEVGVDVPEASIIVIEHAERFGLAQLHQLRGRVGRGGRRARLPAALRAAAGARRRARGWRILRETEDGFRIAEEDLRLRGPGEVLGAAPERRCRASASPTSPHHADLLAGRPRRCRARAARATPACAARAASRCACCCTCSSATTPCGCWPPG